MRLLMIALVSLSVAAPVFAQLNNCASPYWTNTLRCKAFPAQTPQANFGSVPLSATDVKPFTRVFLNTDPAIRCADGTRPVMYVDKAAGAVSNNWVISVTGGGSAGPADTNADGIYDSGQDLANEYAKLSERDEMGTAHKPPMKDFNGINDPDLLRNPVFAGYNRIRVDKCSFDRFMGRVAYTAPGGALTAVGPGGAAFTFDLWQQGYLIMFEALEALGPGLNYTTWSVDAAGNVVASQEALEPLANAEKVLFVGHSGGAHGLYHNIDNLAADFAVYAPEADVRALFDANFIPSNENEAWFDTATPGVNDAYSGVWAGQSIVAGGTFTYDGAVYWPASGVAAQHDSWAAVLDASCVAAHPLDDWKCTDRMHVLLNHVATPFFFREDFTDPNPEHLNGGAGHTMQWGSTSIPYAPCAGPPSACYPTLNTAEHRERLEQQFGTILGSSLTRSELATGADPSLGAGNFPTMVAWMPQCGVHEGAYSDDGYFDTTMTYLTYTYSMRMWLESFMSVGRTNLRGWRVDGWTDWAGNAQTTTTCN